MRVSRALVAAAVAAVLAVGNSASADPVGSRDMPTLAQQAAKRNLASSGGSSEDIVVPYGPLVVAPGSDRVVVLLDNQLPEGWIMSAEAALVDAAGGRIPIEQLAHIRHVDWFRVTHDPVAPTTPLGAEQKFLRRELRQRFGVAPAGLQWIFGTGEEGTRLDLGRVASAEDADANGVADRNYGVHVGQGQQLAVVLQVANETATPLEVFVAFDAEFVHGSAEQVQAVTGAPMLDVTGFTWSKRSDAVAGDGVVSAIFEAPASGMAVWASGHVHQGSYGATIANLGPFGLCSEDIDGDGLPGLTILQARKLDHVEQAWPYSNDYQVATSKAGWRAPVRLGDHLAVFALHDVEGDGRDASDWFPPQFATAAPVGDTADGFAHAYFDSAARAAIHFDYSVRPGLYPRFTDCPTDFENLAAATLIGEDSSRVQQRLLADDFGLGPFYATGITEGMQSAPFRKLEPVCGVAGVANNRGDCDSAVAQPDVGEATDQIVIAGFTYLPGDRALSAVLPAVSRETPLRVTNLDVGIAHSLTSCQWPCDGPALGNYPMADGAVDSGRLELANVWEEARVCSDCSADLSVALDLSSVAPGPLSFYCRVHPWMRGAVYVM